MGRAPSRPKLQNDRNVILVGTPGQGKSATGNSILCKQIFPSDPNFSTVTPGTSFAIEQVDGHRMVVVDTPGIMDVRLENKVKRAGRVIDSLDACFTVWKEGFHALLLVLKYGNRFQSEQIELMKILKRAFGEDIFNDYGIVIVTNGDGFDLDHKGKDLTFDKWYKDQQGPLAELIEECHGRIVLFYNNNYWKNATSVGSLFSLLDKMKAQYTKEMYNEYVSERKKYLLEADAPEYREKMLDHIKRINKQLKTLSAFPRNSENPVTFKTLKKDALQLQWDIDIRDGDTNVFQDLKEDVSKLLEDIQNHQDKETESESLK